MTRNKLIDKHNTIAKQIFCSNAILYIPVVILLLVTFFIDYYVKGSAIQGYNLPAEHFQWFYNIFGNLEDNADQLPVLRLDIFFCIFSIFIVFYDAVYISYIFLKNKNIKTERKIRGIKEYIKAEKEIYKEDIYPVEYITWWILRVAMIWAVFHRIKQGATHEDYMIIITNAIMTFIVPIFRFLFGWMPDTYRLPLRVQSLLNIFIFGGSFLGHGLNLNGEVHDFDKILHFISGCVVVWIGAFLFSFLTEKDNLSVWKKYLVSIGLSMQVMIVWECFEFIADFIFNGMFCQNWYYTRTENVIFARLFGAGANNPQQDAVIDTNLDVIYAVAGCFLGVITMYIYDIINKIIEKRKRGKEVAYVQV